MIEHEDVERFYGGDIPLYILEINESSIKIAYEGMFEEEGKATITIDDVCRYFAYEARNLSSGCRVLGPIQGDWRFVDNIAQEMHELLKFCIPDEYREHVNTNYSEIMTAGW